ncbi:unnamed protein product [Peniophora sp. CBMAI 1063]|nr:unnamed protein product [Peniophora sp. CBMAI 1063]
MDKYTLATLLRDSPDEALLDAVDMGQDHNDIITLLEAELQRSASRLQRLKEYRNQLASPMYRLHPELLSRIMSIYAHGNHELYNLRWTRLILVCRRWHDMAMHSLSLWSFLDIATIRPPPMTKSSKYEETEAQHVRRIEMQLSRAAQSPLSVILELYAEPSEAKLPYTSMFWDPSSLHALRLSGRPDAIEKIMRALACHKHATLRTLKLQCYNSTASTLASMQTSLDVALRDNLPQLWHLSTELTFDWALVRGLRSLRVSYLRDISLSFTLLDVTDALCRCPQLEELEIRLPGTYQPASNPALASPILPCLELAAVVAPLGVCNQLLERISNLPSSTRLFISAADLSHDIPSLSTLSSHIGAHAWGEDAPVIRSLVVTEASTHEFPPIPNSRRLGIIGQMIPLRLTSTPATINWAYDKMYGTSSYVGAQVVVPTSAGPQFLKSVFQFWPLSGVTHLDLRSMLSMPDLLPVLFADAPAVTTVVLRPETPIARDVVDALRSQLREYGRRVLAHIAFDAGRIVNRQPQVQNGWQNALVPSSAVLARHTLMMAMLYCREVASAGVAVDTVEIYNEQYDTRHRLLGPVESVNWSELYKDLRHGFVYEGRMHSDDPEYDGKAWNSFVVSDAM